ncbi:hypothetical protein AB4455_25945 [Vibrio sp. 10N.261.46.E12]|nr:MULTISPECIES: hypothetical protein [unclassified Vibrio]OMO37171.1 hypothetical protein BH584_23890 [Vibrio sp. 10N.261.45.E1]PMJ36317.1 hypothetical protein BCU27_02260 [Vibrio sp. 10N.286.45.B6]PML96008.1 hypothetical protein BCT66_22475 [Vibrio sp. 10N.261.49.E11]PMM83220.1 hypothetical protein BCT46_12785 [Vibrio sp. 10N.261.46.E8]PMN48904.1 hypothetical protein BCT32_06810 [Vibrio sp. 10N.261.45.E11]
MYFYKHLNEDGQIEYVGPFIRPRENLLDDVYKCLESGKSTTLTEDELHILENSEKEVSIYAPNQIELSALIKFRKHLSHHEYRYIYECNKDAMNLSEWFEFIDINSSIHGNYLCGRSLVKGSTAKKLVDLMIAHSYLLEATAFKILRLHINGQKIEDMSRKEFGNNSLDVHKLLKCCRNIGLEYYWHQRSHIDLMQTAIYIETDALRREQMSTGQSKFMTSWGDTAEFTAFAVKRNPKADHAYEHRSTVMTKKLSELLNQLKATRYSNLSKSQIEASEALIVQSMKTLSIFTEVIEDSELLKMLDDLVGYKDKSSNDYLAQAESGDQIHSFELNTLSSPSSAENKVMDNNVTLSVLSDDDPLFDSLDDIISKQ